MIIGSVFFKGDLWRVMDDFNSVLSLDERSCVLVVSPLWISKISFFRDKLSLGSKLMGELCVV